MIDPFIDGLAYLGEVREPFEFSNRRIRRIFAKAIGYLNAVLVEIR